MQDFSLTIDKFLDHAAKWHPNAEVVTAGAGETTDRINYSALRERAKRVSTLLSELGIGLGDRVATLAWNTQSHVECWYAIMGMGAVCHTLNPRLTPEQLAWMVRSSQAGVLIVSADLAQSALAIAKSTPNIKHVLTIDGECEIGQPLDYALLMVKDHTAWGGFDETHPCGLCFTSGTTGEPKGVTYTHRGNYLHTLRLLQVDVIGVSSRDVVLPVVPMFHANAWGLPFAAPATGATLVLPGRHSDGESLARMIASEGVTIAVGVPTVWLALFNYMEESGMDLPSLERVMVGGAPMPPALMARIEERGIKVQTTWGMTELSPLGTATPPQSETRSPVFSGRPALGVDLMLTDVAGEPLPCQREQEGHLWARGASVVERYFGQDKAATRNGWFDTGDLASIDRDGNLCITGRSKELIKSGGEWINPAVIEALVSELPDVELAAVISRPDDKWGERPILMVELREDCALSNEAIIAPLRDRVAGWWIPDEIVRLERIPLAATGKIDKLRLRNEYSKA